MAKDYAKRAKPKAHSKSKTKRSGPPGWLWLATGLVVGLFIAGLIYLNDYNSTPSKPKATPKHLIVKAKKPTPAHHPHNKLKFDFYNVLPSNKKVTPVAANNQRYILQIASLKRYTDADRLKAQLILLGFDAFVSKVTTNRQTWNRVNIGPFGSRNTAEIAQKRLANNHIRSLMKPVRQ